MAQRPYRSELNVAYRDEAGVVVCAGRIDALYVDGEGRVYLLDFKRVDPKHKLSERARGFFGAMGVGAAAHLADTHFNRYSLQLSCYALMLQQSHGVDVGERLYLLRMHRAAKAFELVQCRDLRRKARAVLAAEHERLVAARKKSA